MVAVAILFRIYALGRLPGINGDEAWYGVQAQRWVSGELLYWRTPTGNLPGPLQLGGLLLLQSLFEPSFALLRIPSVIASLGAMALAYAIGRRFFDRTTATVALLLMAALPINIAYARLGWDPSHLGVTILASVYAVLARRRVLSALAFALALTVHPTAAFAGPFLIILALGREMEESPFRPAFLRLLPYGVMLILSLGLLAITTSGGQLSASVAGIGLRIFDPVSWAAFPKSFTGLLTGETAYVYITGRDFGALTPYMAIAGWLSIVGLTGIGLFSLRRQRFGRELALLAGWLISLLLFFVIAGPGALQPHFERYAVWLVAPSALALALCIRRAFPTGNKAIAFTFAIAALLLAGFWQSYFQVLENRGSLSARTFWTGPIEPKQVARERLAAIARANGPIRVVAEDWWLYWPVAYLSRGQAIDLVNAERQIPAAPRNGLTWLVYNGSRLDRRVAATPGARLLSSVDATGHPKALLIWWTPAVNRPGAQPPPARR